jgi:predicted phage-related endonuclease
MHFTYFFTTETQNTRRLKSIFDSISQKTLRLCCEYLKYGINDIP